MDEDLVPVGVIRKTYTTVWIPKDIADRLDAALKEASLSQFPEEDIPFPEAEEWLDKNDAWPSDSEWETYDTLFYYV